MGPAMRSLFPVVGLTLVFCSPLCGEETLPSAEEIRNHLRRWHSGFVSFRIGYENTWPGTPIRKYREFLMTDSNEYLEFEDWYFRPDRPHPFREVRGGNQQMRFRASYDLNESRKEWVLTGVTRQKRNTSNIGSTMIIQPLWPMLEPHPGRWLDETLSDQKITVKRGGMIDGERCVLVELEYQNERKLAGDQIWLAIDKGYLPKKTVPMKSQVLTNAHYFCEEFRFDGERWYPLKGRIGEGEDANYWRVTEFEVNPKVSPSIFRAPDDSLLRRTVSDKDLQSNSETRRATQASTAKEGLPVASRSGWSNIDWSLILLVCSALVGGAAFWRSRLDT